MSETTSVGEDFPKQQARCRQMLEDAISIGPEGRFLAAMLRNTLARAEHAALSGDVVKILAAYTDMKEYKS